MAPQQALFAMGAIIRNGRTERGRARRSLRPGPSLALHGLARLLALITQVESSVGRNKGSRSLLTRRLHQRRRLMQQVLEANEGFQALAPQAKGWWFWQGLRWSGPFVLIGWCLAQMAVR